MSDAKPANQYDEACARAKALGCNCDSPDWGEHWPGVIEGAEGPPRCPLAPNLFKQRVGALLAKIEFKFPVPAELSPSGFEFTGCPECKGRSTSWVPAATGHRPGCELAALLRECRS